MRGAPRFGHTSQFSLLFSDNNDDRIDYLNGLLFIGCFVIAIVVVWLLLLGVFRCLGPKRVGFFSGGNMRQQTDPYPRAFRVRMTYLNAAIIFVIFSILYVVNGVTNLQDTVIAISNGNEVCAIHEIVLVENQFLINLRCTGSAAAAQ